jgi:hypothetical protein
MNEYDSRTSRGYEDVTAMGVNHKTEEVGFKYLWQYTTLAYGGLISEILGVEVC